MLMKQFKRDHSKQSKHTNWQQQSKRSSSQNQDYSKTQDHSQGNNDQGQAPDTVKLSVINSNQKEKSKKAQWITGITPAKSETMIKTKQREHRNHKITRTCRATNPVRQKNNRLQKHQISKQLISERPEHNQMTWGQRNKHRTNRQRNRTSTAKASTTWRSSISHNKSIMK